MKPVIECSGIGKTYKMGQVEVPALLEASFKLPQGIFAAIVGPSGSGKSTLMNILGCLDTASAGEYSLEGRRVNGLSSSALADLRNRRIGFIFQSFNLLSRYNVYANVELPLIYSGLDNRTRKERVRKAVEAVGLQDRLRHRPSELSGGQRQRVAIARALANEPALILADEPTGNLDSVTGKEIIALFRDLVSRGRTVVIVTHDQAIAKSAEALIEIRDGRIVRTRGLDRGVS